jgi:hypothetical protein
MWFQVIVIIGPPPAVAYPFILDIEGYPQQIINFFIVIVRLSTLVRVIPHLSMYAGSILAKMEEAKCRPAVQR